MMTDARSKIWMHGWTDGVQLSCSKKAARASAHCQNLQTFSLAPFNVPKLQSENGNFGVWSLWLYLKKKENLNIALAHVIRLFYANLGLYMDMKDPCLLTVHQAKNHVAKRTASRGSETRMCQGTDVGRITKDKGIIKNSWSSRDLVCKWENSAHQQSEVLGKAATQKHLLS